MAIATKLEDTSTQLALFTEDQSLVQGILFFVSRMTRREIAIGYINIFRFRHVGDFGNVEAIENQGINAMFTDSLATLMTGPNSILHRTLVVTEI
jgi:hypothetical protein